MDIFFEPPPPTEHEHAPPPWCQPSVDAMARLAPDRRELVRARTLTVPLQVIAKTPADSTSRPADHRAAGSTSVRRDNK